MDTPFLDDITKVNELDAHQTRVSIEQLGSQIQQIWDLSQSLEFGEEYSQLTNVVVAGMGGSILGTDVIQTLFKDQLSVPITICPDYTVPNFVDDSTLVIGSSYSGNTEETLSAIQDAVSKGAKVTGITSGGKLDAFLNEHNAPHLTFPTEYNPSQCARMGLGYSIFGQMMLMAKLGLITITKADYQAVLDAVAAAQLDNAIAAPQNDNPAKMLAFSLIDRLPVIMVAEHLEGIGHVFANQLNENAKTLAEYRVIPELNHHLLEGYSHPEPAKQHLQVVSIHSDLYHPSNQNRFDLTEQLLTKHHIEVLQHQLTSSTKIEEAFELLTFGAYTAFYLAMLYNVDPIPNPNVDWLKSNLSN